MNIATFPKLFRITPFSARISVTSLSRLDGRGCRPCARAELSNNINGSEGDRG